MSLRTQTLSILSSLGFLPVTFLSSDLSSHGHKMADVAPDNIAPDDTVSF